MATLSAIRLLRQLPSGDDLPIGCITFACPTMGNAALAALASGWAPYLRNYLLPGTSAGCTPWLVKHLFFWGEPTPGIFVLAPEDVVSQLGSFDGYNRRLLNPIAPADSAAQAAAEALHATGSTSEPQKGEITDDVGR